MCLFLLPLPIPHNFWSWLTILKCLFDPLLLFYVMWPGLSLQPERLLIRLVQLLFESTLSPVKDFCWKWSFGCCSMPLLEDCPLTWSNLPVISQPSHLSVSSKGEDNKPILFVNKIVFSVYMIKLVICCDNCHLSTRKHDDVPALWIICYPAKHPNEQAYQLLLIFP